MLRSNGLSAVVSMTTGSRYDGLEHATKDGKNEHLSFTVNDLAGEAMRVRGTSPDEKGIRKWVPEDGHLIVAVHNPMRFIFRYRPCVCEPIANITSTSRCISPVSSLKNLARHVPYTRYTHHDSCGSTTPRALITGGCAFGACNPAFKRTVAGVGSSHGKQGRVDWDTLAGMMEKKIVLTRLPVPNIGPGSGCGIHVTPNCLDRKIASDEGEMFRGHGSAHYEIGAAATNMDGIETSDGSDCLTGRGHIPEMHRTELIRYRRLANRNTAIAHRSGINAH